MSYSTLGYFVQSRIVKVGAKAGSELSTERTLALLSSAQTEHRFCVIKSET
jgi:hypothetical protein